MPPAEVHDADAAKSRYGPSLCAQFFNNDQCVYQQAAEESLLVSRAGIL